MTVRAPFLIARSAKRERHDVDSGVFWHEWRIRELDDSEQAEAAQAYGFNRRLRYALESRRMDEPTYVDASMAQWRVFDFGGTCEQAAASCPNQDYLGAESLHPYHRAVTEAGKRRLALHRAKQALRDWQGMGSAYLLECEARAEYETRLKRARLWKLVQTDSAPQDKVDAIRDAVKAEYLPRIKTRKALEEKVATKLAALEARV